MNPATFLRSLGPKPWKTALPRAGDPPARRPLRREPDALPALLPVPGDPEAAPDDVLRALPRVAARDRARHRASTTSASSRTTGSSRPSARGGSAGRCGATGWRSRSSRTSSSSAARARPDPGGDHLRPRPHRDGRSRRSRRCSISTGRDGITWGDVYRRTSASGRTTTSRRPTSSMHDAPLRRLRGRAHASRSSAAAAAGLRLRAQVLARVQPARRARRDLGHRARRVHRPRAEPRPRGRAALPRAAAGEGSMPRLLFEIGCEELPAAACMEAALQLPELVARAPRRAAARALHRPAPARVPCRRARADRGRVDQGPAGEPAREGGGRLREALRRQRRRPDAARRLPRLEVPGRPIAEVLPERLAAIVTRAAVRRSRWTGARASGSRGRCAGCARSSTTDDRCCARARAERRLLLRASPVASGAGRDPDRGRLSRHAARGRRRAGSRSALRADRAPGSTRSGRGATRSASSTRSSTSSRRRTCRRARSTSASCGCPSA